MVNGTLKNHSLYRELLTLDLRDILKHIRIPYHIIQGSTDIVTPTKYIEAFVKASPNENLHFCLAPDSGHLSGGKGMQFIIENGFSRFDSEKH